MPAKTPVLFLMELEWSIGQAQCPACSGLNPQVYGTSHPYAPSDAIGHKHGCPLRLAIGEIAEVEKLRADLAESNRLLETARAQLSIAMPAVSATDRRIDEMKREVAAAEKKAKDALDDRLRSERENNRLHMALSEARRQLHGYVGGHAEATANRLARLVEGLERLLREAGES